MSYCTHDMSYCLCPMNDGRDSPKRVGERRDKASLPRCGRPTSKPTEFPTPQGSYEVEPAKKSESNRRRKRTPTLNGFASVEAPKHESHERISVVPEAEIQERAKRFEEIVEKVAGLDGVLACALVDDRTGASLGAWSRVTEFDVELAARGSADIVRAKMGLVEQLGITEPIEDICISLEAQYHVAIPLLALGPCFLFVAIDRARGNLGMARLKLSALASDLVEGK